MSEIDDSEEAGIALVSELFDRINRDRIPGRSGPPKWPTIKDVRNVRTRRFGHPGGTDQIRIHLYEAKARQAEKAQRHDEAAKLREKIARVRSDHTARVISEDQRLRGTALSGDLHRVILLVREEDVEPLERVAQLISQGSALEEAARFVLFPPPEDDTEKVESSFQASSTPG